MFPQSWIPRYAPELVRVGPRHDGGYVIARDSMRQADMLVSLGLNDDWRFEAQFRAENGCRILIYDHTVNRGFWIRRLLGQVTDLLRGKGLPSEPLLFLAYRRFFDGNAARHVKEKIGYRSPGTTSLADILATVDSTNIFLKIDIEGWEYRIFQDIVANASRLTGIAMEIHDIDLHRERISAFIADLSPALELIHLHPNNGGGVDDKGDPILIEMSFARLSPAGRETRFAGSYPIAGLDDINVPHQPEVAMVFG